VATPLQFLLGLLHHQTRFPGPFPQTRNRLRSVPPEVRVAFLSASGLLAFREKELGSRESGKREKKSTLKVSRCITCDLSYCSDTPDYQNAWLRDNFALRRELCENGFLLSLPTNSATLQKPPSFHKILLELP
jgi:hypothetical protein